MKVASAIASSASSISFKIVILDLSFSARRESDYCLTSFLRIKIFLSFNCRSCTESSNFFDNTFILAALLQKHRLVPSTSRRARCSLRSCIECNLLSSGIRWKGESISCPGIIISFSFILVPSCLPACGTCFLPLRRFPVRVRIDHINW